MVSGGEGRGDMHVLPGQDCSMHITVPLSHIGTVLRKQGKYSEALARFEESLAIEEKLLGREHMDVAASLASIGMVDGDQGMHSKALEKHKECLLIEQKLVGRVHMSVAESLSNIGTVLYCLGKLSEALVKYEESLAIKETLVGREHTSVAAALLNIANVLQDQCMHEEALTEYEESLAIHEMVLGREHMDVAGSLFSIGNVFFCQGKHSQALEKREESLGEAGRSGTHGRCSITREHWACALRSEEAVGGARQVRGGSGNQSRARHARGRAHGGDSLSITHRLPQPNAESARASPGPPVGHWHSAPVQEEECTSESALSAATQAESCTRQR